MGRPANMTTAQKQEARRRRAAPMSPAAIYKVTANG